MRFILVLAFAVVLGSCSSEAPAPIVVSDAPPQVIDRGRELVKGLAACGFCHGENPTASSILAGGRVLEDRYGRVHAPNITPARSGIGEWSDDTIVRAIRASINANDEWLSSEMHRGYEWMADEDVLAIVAYLRTLPAVEKTVERRTLGFVDRNTKGLFDVRREVKGYVPSIDRKASAEYGQYLTDHVARCGGCHNSPWSLIREEEYLVGGKTIRSDLGEKVAPAITSSTVYGLGEWNEQAIVHYLKTGETRDGNIVDANFCPVGFFRNASDEDLLAIARYLKSVP